MLNPIEAVFDGTVFRPESEVELKPNTRVEITVTIKSVGGNPNKFHVKSKRLGFREDLNYDKINSLPEEVEDAS